MSLKYFGTDTLINYLNARDDVVKINGEFYREVFNASFTYQINELFKTPWHFDQINEALSVLTGNPTSRYEDYHQCWIRGVPRALSEFLNDSNTRRAIIPFQKENGSPTCLTSIQFQMRNRKLFVAANFRSWEIEEFAQYDLCLLTYLINDFSYHLHLPKLSLLTINAANAHIKL